MKNTLTLGRSVAAMAAICTLICICLLTVMLAGSTQAIITKRVHLYERDDGTISRVVDPWRPLPGCLFLQSAQGRVLWPLDGKNSYNPGMTALCGVAPLVLPDGVVPRALNQLLLGLNNQWRAPLQRNNAVPMNAVERDGMIVTQGAHVELTLDANRQGTAQALAECMTGHGAACAGLGLPAATWEQNSEGAAARMFGVVVLDVETGAIEVLASSDSACYAAEYSGRMLAQDCPVPALARGHPLPGKLEHHAFTGARPGSLVKPIMVVAFLRDPLLGARLRVKGSAARRALVNDIKNSDSPDFLDQAYCRDLNFAHCRRLQEIAAASDSLGWNARAGNLLALSGSDEEQARPAVSQLVPHFMQTLNRQGLWHAMPLDYDADQARACALQAAKMHRWGRCRGAVANSASELIGQGNAIASPLTIADMLTKIARAANGRQDQLPLHLLQSVHGQTERQPAYLLPDQKPIPLGISKQEADLILEGMALTHRGGTASSGCVKAYGSTRDAQAACLRLSGVAGKTGTPGFADEAYTWMERSALCRQVQQGLNEGGLTVGQRNRLSLARTRCVQSPVKWYAALLRDNPAGSTGPWTKVMVVLAERNYRTDGWIDSRGDTGTPNIAAEFGFRLIRLTERQP